jgi:hypothetical protein
MELIKMEGMLRTMNEQQMGEEGDVAVLFECVQLLACFMFI